MKVTLELEEDDYPSLHDTVLDVTDYSYSNNELLMIWSRLPEDIRLDAAKWGMSDTEVREKIHGHLEEELKK